jgi:hypothetical protein
MRSRPAASSSIQQHHAIEHQPPYATAVTARQFDADQGPGVAAHEVDLLDPHRIQHPHYAVGVIGDVGIVARRGRGIAIAEHVGRNRPPRFSEFGDEWHEALRRSWAGMRHIERQCAL